MFSSLTGELEGWRPALLRSIAHSNSSSVSHPCGTISLLIWHALCFSEPPVVVRFRTATAAGMKDYAGFTDRLEFFFVLCQVFLCRLNLAWGQLQGFLYLSLYLCLSLSFRQSHCHSLLSQRIATSVLALCVCTVQYTQTHNMLYRACVYSVPLTKCQPMNGIAKNIPSVYHCYSVFVALGAVYH